MSFQKTLPGEFDGISETTAICNFVKISRIKRKKRKENTMQLTK